MTVRVALRVRRMTTATPGLRAKSAHSAPIPPMTATHSFSPTQLAASLALSGPSTMTPTQVRPVMSAALVKPIQSLDPATVTRVLHVSRVAGPRSRARRRAPIVSLGRSVDRPTTSDACRATRQKANGARPARHIRWQQPGTSPSSPRAPQARTQQPSQRASLSRTRVLGHVPTRMRRTSRRKTPSPRRNKLRASAAALPGWAGTAARPATEARGARCVLGTTRTRSARMQSRTDTIASSHAASRARATRGAPARSKLLPSGLVTDTTMRPGSHSR